MSYQYADQANKTITKAVPFIDGDGKVVKWEVEVEFELNDYKSNLSTTVELEPSKAPSDFTKAEILAFPQVAYLSAVYDSQYQSTQLPADAPSEVKVDDFDVEELA